MVCSWWNSISLSPSFWCSFNFPKARSALDPESLFSALSHPRFSRLQRLELGWTYKIDDNTLCRLFTSCPSLVDSLQSLEIHRCCGVDDKSAKRISMLKNLKNLKMYNSSNWKGITDVGMRELAKLPHLEVLQLNFFKRITNDGLAALNSLNHLKELRVSGAPLISDKGVTSLALPELEVLSLSLCGTLTDRMLVAIPNCFPRLKYLSLGYNTPNSYFTDHGLYPSFEFLIKALKDLRQLTELRLERTWGHLSGPAVRLLRHTLPNLQKLYLRLLRLFMFKFSIIVLSINR